MNMLISRRFQRILSQRLNEQAPLLQIIIGPRQVGKTTAAKQIYDSWIGPKLFISADSPSPPHAEWIQQNWIKALSLGRGCLFIIDEIQKVPGWSEQVKILFDEERGKGNLKIVLLGSSSLGLQRGLTESLAGRFELLTAPHWTYSEFNEAFGWDINQYLKYGAYPGAAQFIGDEQRWRDYILQSIIEPVLGKDILGLNPVNKPALFRQTFELAVQHPSRILSLQKMLGQLQDRGNASTIKHYLELLDKSFLVKPLQRFSGSVLQTRASKPKLLILNHALTHAYCPPSRFDDDPAWFGFLFESIVGMHLLQVPDSELFYWHDGNFEVDYVLKTPKSVFGIEIKSGFRKKAGGLAKFSKNYPKAICETWTYDRCISFMKGASFS